MGMTEAQLELFWDSASGGFFSTEAGATDLILRLKDGVDHAEPSANGISAQNLYRLSSMFEDSSYKKHAQETCDAFAAEIVSHPFQFSSMMSAIVAGDLGTRNHILVGARGNRLLNRVSNRLRASVPTGNAIETFVRRFFVKGGAEVGKDWICQRNPLLDVMGHDGRIKVVVCEQGTCREETDLFEGDDPDDASTCGDDDGGINGRDNHHRKIGNDDSESVTGQGYDSSGLFKIEPAGPSDGTAKRQDSPDLVKAEVEGPLNDHAKNQGDSDRSKS